MKATVAYEAGLDPVLVKIPVKMVIKVKTSHISAMDMRRSGRRPTLAGRNAKPTEQANENIDDVAVMSVWWSLVVIPTSSSIYRQVS